MGQSSGTSRVVDAAGANIAQVNTFGDLNTNPNAVQQPTYVFTAKPTAAALSINTLSLRTSLHHAATATKLVKIRRIKVSGLFSAAVHASNIEVHRITAAPTGTAVTGGSATASLLPLHTADAAPEATANNSLTAATSVGLLCSMFIATVSANAANGGGCIVYDWQDAGQQRPITLRPGVLEGIAIGIISNTVVTPTLTTEIHFTEE